MGAASAAKMQRARCGQVTLDLGSRRVTADLESRRFMAELSHPRDAPTPGAAVQSWQTRTERLGLPRSLGDGAVPCVRLRTQGVQSIIGTPRR